MTPVERAFSRVHEDSERLKGEVFFLKIVVSLLVQNQPEPERDHTYNVMQHLLDTFSTKHDLVGSDSFAAGMRAASSAIIPTNLAAVEESGG